MFNRYYYILLLPQAWFAVPDVELCLPCPLLNCACSAQCWFAFIVPKIELYWVPNVELSLQCPMLSCICSAQCWVVFAVPNVELYLQCPMLSCLLCVLPPSNKVLPWSRLRLPASSSTMFSLSRLTIVNFDNFRLCYSCLLLIKCKFFICLHNHYTCY